MAIPAFAPQKRPHHYETTHFFLSGKAGRLREPAYCPVPHRAVAFDLLYYGMAVTPFSDLGILFRDRTHRRVPVQFLCDLRDLLRDHPGPAAHLSADGAARDPDDLWHRQLRHFVESCYTFRFYRLKYGHRPSDHAEYDLFHGTAGRHLFCRAGHLCRSDGLSVPS